MNEQTVKRLFDEYFTFAQVSDCIAITDIVQFIYYRKSDSVDVSISVGESVKKEPITYKALTNREVKEGYSKRFNTSYYALSRPVMEGEVLKGAITFFFEREPSKMNTPYLTIRMSEAWKPVHLDEVVFIEAQNRRTYVISTNVKGTYRLNLKRLEHVLPANTFIRCHRSYIININKIKEIQPASHATFTLIMEGGYRVPVSQNYVSTLRDFLNF